jgi:hypothetical protein
MNRTILVKNGCNLFREGHMRGAWIVSGRLGQQRVHRSSGLDADLHAVQIRFATLGVNAQVCFHGRPMGNIVPEIGCTPSAGLLFASVAFMTAGMAVRT